MKKAERILPINTCSECPYCNMKNYTAQCDHPGPMETAAMDEDSAPPDWCPLPIGGSDRDEP